MISDFSFQGRLLEFFSSCFSPCIDCILLNLLVGAAVGQIVQTYVLTSCAPLSNAVIARNMIAILLRFPFNCMPSNEICASTISPTRIALGLILWCLHNYFQLYSFKLVFDDSLSSPSFLACFIIFNFIVFCMDKLLSHCLREYIVRVDSWAE
jgi:hypothetical protein